MFDTLTQCEPDAIIALMQVAKADTNPNKIDLGVGVYKTDDGATPIMRAVKQAEALYHHEEITKSYVSTSGNMEFRRLMTDLILGDNHPAGDRIATAQGVGGSGALRLCVEVIKAASPQATVWVSTPTWANHIPMLESVGLGLASYPYYNKETLSVDFDAMMDTVSTGARSGDVILLHGCCHNPSGADLTHEQWDTVTDLMADRGLVPFIDLAYAGLGHGLETDLYGLRKVVATLPNVLSGISCSKNFAVYKERVGMALILAETPEQADIVQSELGLVQRRLVSMPPDHGAALVARILGDRDLRQMWADELDEMQTRISDLRVTLSEALNVQGGEVIARAVREQNGMFSMLGLSKDQVRALRKKSIYMTDSARINIAGANLKTIPQFADAILEVL
ncbi:MAG: aspartate/tyrosine/aromatic aminotransferase [Hyphomonadaceae bacterium]|nr:aspartate/tyrosine/aromatic aminotransferase [Hyphomonadaceae bacterium]MBC6412273.1 aspartate/tyrosine/aromatic aminotransferase [Hyphomonadaceae bacterium]